ncbi:membrane protein, HPP family [Thraustotheca clavata]|uniref:Membrane protein, HPP family n=1 Tax=Thraustotheca clavata TaxID=74557 RepID=A0A1V9ZX69_9STRA|nr:membrane protein, HPP family [Thraustotheca clavata]
MTTEELVIDTHRHLEPLHIIHTPRSNRMSSHYIADLHDEDIIEKSNGKNTLSKRLRMYFVKLCGRDDLTNLKEVNPALDALVCDRKTLQTIDKIPNHGLKKARILIWSFISSFIGIGILAALQYSASIYLYPSDQKITTIIGSFGAMSILVFGTIEAPFAQPRNAILGNTLSAFVGVAVSKGFSTTNSPEEYMWIACALSVSLSLVAMQLTDTVHPPGGATALIAVTSGQEIINLGFFYAVFPVFVGSCILVGVSVIFNNIERKNGIGTSQEVNPAVDMCLADSAVKLAHLTDQDLQWKRLRVLFWSFVSCFVGIAVLAALNYNVRWYMYPSDEPVTTLIGSFGATSILVFGAVEAPLAQPRNVIFGNSISAFVGVAVSKILYIQSTSDEYMWLGCALAVSLSLIFMLLTDTVHPPGGAAALIAVTSPKAIQSLGFFYVFCPVFLGSCVLITVSLSTTSRDNIHAIGFIKAFTINTLYISSYYIVADPNMGLLH